MFSPIVLNMSESLWRFLDSRDETRIILVQGLESARVFTSLIPSAEAVMWIVEHESLTGVQTLAECSALTGVAATEIVTIGLKKEEDPIRTNGGSGRERRKHLRVNARLKVIIMAGDDMFSCCSTNVSIGGLLLENPIPTHFLNRDVKVLISSSNNLLQLQFKVKILEASVRGSRLMFDGDMDLLNQSKLQEWIDAHSHDVAA